MAGPPTVRAGPVTSTARTAQVWPDVSLAQRRRLPQYHQIIKFGERLRSALLIWKSTKQIDGRRIPRFKAPMPGRPGSAGSSV